MIGLANMEFKNEVGQINSVGVVIRRADRAGEFSGAEILVVASDNLMADRNVVGQVVDVVANRVLANVHPDSLFFYSLSTTGDTGFRIDRLHLGKAWRLRRSTELDYRRAALTEPDRDALINRFLHSTTTSMRAV